MRRLLQCAVAVLVLGGFTALNAAEDKKADKTDDKALKEKGATGKLTPPKMRFAHTTNRGNKGEFDLNGKTGTANYVFDGSQHKDKLVYVRTATLGGIEGWVYQVERKGKKVDVWFLFGSKPVLTRGGEKLYPMYYTQTPEDSTGKQPWTRILTPGGTKGTPLGKKTDEDED